ncbi:hypothetical protein ACCO45_012721 [Purpureocillium lilacinum]|uniref:Uncharacterized protein n=1 Tax=Purpureocillium lilacinum TaxID=33203 RepID=A0ACC4DBW4_PURLI
MLLTARRPVSSPSPHGKFARTVSTDTEKGHEPARIDFRRSGAQDPVSSPLEFGHANGRPVASIAIRYGKLDRDTDCSEALNGSSCETHPGDACGSFDVSLLSSTSAIAGRIVVADGNNPTGTYLGTVKQRSAAIVIVINYGRIHCIENEQCI